MPLSRRRLDFQTFDQLLADVGRLRENGYEQVGDWTLAQVLDHLALATEMSLDPAKGMPRPVRWLFRPILGRMLRTRSMPRMPAPKVLRPAEAAAVDETSAAVRFERVIDQVVNLTGDKIDHPAFGWISVYDFQQLALVHAARHLSFLIPREK